MRKTKTGLKKAALIACAIIAILPCIQSRARAEAEEAYLFSREELTQMLAPIALYPDSLIAQILMASTYPLEIVMAERWLRENEDLQGAADRR